MASQPPAGVVGVVVVAVVVVSVVLVTVFVVVVSVVVGGQPRCSCSQHHAFQSGVQATRHVPYSASQSYGASVATCADAVATKPKLKI